MSERPDTMPLSEFRDLGYLQEANRQFFHPLGLALGVTLEDDGTVSGLVVFTDDDPEGWMFSEGELTKPDSQQKAAFVATRTLERAPVRREALGFWVQPMPLMW